MKHLYVPIDSTGDKEQWFGCEGCGAKLPKSELELIAKVLDGIGECVAAPESEPPCPT